MRAFPGVAAALLCALVAQQAAASCYVIYGADGQVLYRRVEPPVDLSLPLHQTLPQAAPGGKLVFTLDNQGCEAEINRLASRRTAPATPPVPTPSPAKG